MKKGKTLLLAAALLVAVLSNSLGISGASAWVGDSYESPEIAFTSIMNEMNSDFGYEYDAYTYVSAPTQNLAGALSGYVYDFTLDETRDGFMLLTKVEYQNTTMYEVTELFFDDKSPFFGNEGINLYPTFMKYYSLVDGVYYNLLTGDGSSEDEVRFYEETGFGFSGGEGIFYDWSETVTYDTVITQQDKITYGFTNYLQGTSLGDNTCAVKAGKNIIAYWDYQKPNLIPDYNPMQLVYNGNYYWKSESSAISWVTDELYRFMETNTLGDGTTATQFINGIKSYATAYGGYGVTFHSTMTSGSYDINKMVAEFNSNRPVMLFTLPKFNLCQVNGAGNQDKYSGYLVEGGHGMVAYGRKQITYYNNGYLVRKFDMLMVAGCMTPFSQGYVRMNEGYLDIYNSFSVEIS